MDQQSRRRRSEGRGSGRGPVALATGLLAVLGLVAPVTGQDADAEGVLPGTVPPAVSLETLEGEAFPLDPSALDRPVLVEFWATWCAVCRALEPRLTAAHERFGNRVDFLTVAVGIGQEPGSIRRHLQRHPQPGRLLWDGDGAAVRAFEAPGTGVVYILDENGAVAYRGSGADQDLQAALAEILDEGS